MHKCAAPSRADAFATDASASFANGIRSSMIGAGRTAAGARASRKVRTPQGRVLGNAQAGKPDGKCNRETDRRSGP